MPSYNSSLDASLPASPASDCERNSTFLSDLSPEDKAWDVHRGECDDVRNLYFEHQQLSYHRRMSGCSGELGFSWQTDSESGEMRFKLRTARFCRVRYCPVCQWRRSLMWRARFWSALPGIVEAYPKSRWLFLTLTVQNCEITALRSTIQHLNQSWHRLVKRLEFKSVQGWIRTTEVTRSVEGLAHPHFHCLLMVSSTYFTGAGYINQEQWTEAWKTCLKIDYTPIVDVRAVKSKKKKQADNVLNGKFSIEEISAGIADAITETLKYSVKPADMVSDNGDWFVELTKQTHKLRFIASGGVLKNVLKEADESDEGMTGTEGEGESSEPTLFFDWRERMRRYAKKTGA